MPDGSFTPSPTAIARIECVVIVAEGLVSCPASATSSTARAFALAAEFGGARNDVILGQQGVLAALGTSNATYAGQVLSFDATVTNLVGQALGTTDGTTPDPNGVRAFFPVAPRVTNGSGTIDFVDPQGGGSLVDGAATFTAPNQPFYQYTGILATGRTSAPKRWRFHVPSSVVAFTFSVDLNAAVARPGGWVDLAPATLRLRTGQTSALSAVVRDLVGAAVSGATVTWSSSASDIASVNASTGLVTGVADGSATITGTSVVGTITRTGTTTVLVNTAAAATTTITASTASLLPDATATITVQAKNSAGANITVGGDAVSLGASAGTLSGVIDRGDGTYTVTLTNRAPGVVRVSGTINGIAIAQTAMVTFVGSIASVMTKAAGDAQSAPVATAVATPPAVRITDANGSAVAGVSVTFAVTSGGGSGGGTQVTNANGIATSSGWTVGRAAGPNTMTASAGALSTTFSANATAPAVGMLAKAAGDGQTAPVATTVGVAPAVRIADANGDPIAGLTVTFTPAGGGSVTGGTQLTNATGVATVGSWTLSGVTGSNVLTVTAGELSTTFVATGAAGAAANIAKVSGDLQVATAGATVAVAPSIRITDARGNAVPGVTVTFAVAGGNGGLTGGTQVTNGGGVATLDSWTLGASAGANALTVTAGVLTVTFNATAVPPSAGSIVKTAGDAQSTTAGGSVATPPAVRVVNSSGAPVSGVSVTFAVVSGGGSVTGGTQTTNAAGIAVLGGWTLGATAGLNTLTATAGQLQTTFTATAVPGAPATITKLAGDAQTATVGTPVATAPAILIADSFGNPIPGVNVTFTVASGGGSIIGGTQTTNASGVASVGSWTVGSVAGPNTLATVAGSLTTTFGATAVSLAAGSIVKIAGDGQTAAVGAAVPVAPAVRVNDANGNPLPGVSVTFAPSGTGSVTGGVQITNADGVATVGSWTLGSAVGSNTLIVSAGGALSTSFTASATPGPIASMVKVAGDGQSATAGTAVATPPAVRIIDASGNARPNLPVTFTVASGGGSVTGGSVTSDANGVATVGSWTLGTTAGSNNNTLTATASGNSVTFTASATTGVVDHFLVEAAGGGAIATQVAGTAFNVRMTAQDANNNTLTSFAGTVNVTSNRAGSAGLTTSAAFTAGILANHGITLTEAGPATTITATRTGGAESGVSNGFTVGAGALARFLVEAAGGGAIGTQSAGTPFSVRVTAQDANNNIVTGFTGTVDVTSNRTASAGLTTSAAFVAGVLSSHSVTLTQPGAGSTVTATRTGSAETGTSAAFAVAPGVADHFLVEAAGGGVIGAQAAGVPFNIRVTAQDASNNTVTSFAGTVDITSNRAGSAGLGTTPVFVAGVLTSHAVTLTQIGAGSTIAATRTGGVETGTSNAFTVNPGALDHFLVEAAGGGLIPTQTAGTAFAIRVTAQDANNNTLTGFTGTADVTSNRAGSTGLTTTAAFTAGVLASHSVTLTQAGAASTITATRTGGAETGTSGAFTVSSGALHHFVVEAPGGGAIGTQTAGASFATQITAQDASNNTVTSFTGTVDVTSNRAGSAGLTTTAAFTAGVLANHSVTLTQTGAASTIIVTRTGGAEAGVSAGFAVTAGAIDHFLVEAAGGGAIGTQAAATPFSVRITAQDAANNTMTSFTGTVDVTSNRTGSAGLVTTAAFTAGVLASHSVTLTKSGAGSTITATRSSGGAQTGTSNAFTVDPGALHHFAVEGQGGGAIGAQTAGVPFSVRFTAQDASNNTVTAFSSTVDVTSNRTGSAGLTTTAAFTAGVLAAHSVTLTQSGAGSTITALRTGGTETGTSNTFTVNTAALHHFLVEALGGGAIATQAAGAPFNIRLTAQDASNNTVTSFIGTVDVTSNRTGSAGLTTTAAFTAGVLASHTVALTQPGAASTITATRSGGAETGTSAAFTVNPGALHHFAVEAAGGGAIATQITNTPFNIRVTAQDASNNTVTAFAGTVDITSTGTLSAGNGTTAAFAAGVLASHAVTISNAGSFTITATRTAGVEAGTSAAFTVNVPLAVSSTVPADAATGVALNSTIVVTFNRSVSATTSSFTLKCPSSGSALPYGLSASPATSFTLTPGSALPGGTVCQVTVVAAQVTDAGGLHLPADFVFSFTVGLSVTDDTYPQTVIGNVSVNSANIPYAATTNDAIDASATITFVGWSSIPGVTENGGTIAMTASGANRGQFTYDPPVGFVGTDHFTYTATNAAGSASATVSLTVSGMVWFVNNNAGACSSSCDGRLSHPFTTLPLFQGVNNGTGRNPAAGHSIFLYESAASYTGPVTVLNNQKLIGQDASSTLAAITALTPPSGSAAFPATNVGGANTTIAGASGGVVVATGGNAVVRGLTIATTGGTGFTTGVSFGTLTFANGTTEASDVTINVTGGGAMFVRGGVVSGVITSVSSTGGTNGINLVTLTGTLSINGGALSGSTSTPFVMNSGTATITYAGTLTQLIADRVVTLSNRTGGTATISGNLSCSALCRGVLMSNNTGGTANFSGASKILTTGANFGVFLQSNTGATMNFPNGGLVISTTSGTGFHSFPGGTVTVTGSGNTINSTTGTALNIQNTTIGASGVTFQSISAAGGANGIVVMNTGSSGGLTVTGTAGACTRSTATCTGGTINATVGGDGGTSGIGIYLSSTSNVVLKKMRINGTHQNFGIYGAGVSGMTLDTVLFDGTFGTNSAINEGAASFDELAGSVLVRDSYFANGVQNNFRVRNASAATTLNRITFQTDTLGFTNTGAASNAGIQVLVDAGTTNVTVANTSFLGAYQYNLEFLINNGGSDLILQNNLFRNTQSNTNSTFSHFRARADASSHLTTGAVTYAVSGNDFRDSRQAPIFMAKGDGIWTLNGSITGNTIGNAAVTNSGSLNGEGIRIEHSGQGKHKVLVNNNQIRQYNNVAGISIRALSEIVGVTNDGSIHATVTGNTVSNPGTNVGTLVDAVHLDYGTAAGSSYTLCVNLGHTGGANTILNGAGGAQGVPVSVGPITPTGNGGFLKLLGLAGGPFTGHAGESPVDVLTRADNGLGSTSGFFDFGTATTITSSTDNIRGVACDLP